MHTDSNTNYAQGGIAAALSPLDDFETHLQDTLSAGDGLCDEPVTRGKQAAYLAMARHWDQAVALAQEIEHDDPEGRGSLVLAAADVVAGDCARYRELRAAWSGDMDAQMMPVLRFGGHPDLASALSDGVLCVDPGPEAP